MEKQRMNVTIERTDKEKSKCRKTLTHTAEINPFFTGVLRRYHYKALETHPHHNYYEGRAEADLTGWVDYFVSMLLKAYEGVKIETAGMTKGEKKVDADLFRQLDRRTKIIIPLFKDNAEITSGDIANILRVSRRMAGNYAGEWIKKGIIEIANESDKSRTYKLSKMYEKIFKD